MCIECCSEQVKGALSGAGSIALDTKYDGPSAQDEKFEGEKSSAA